MGLFGFGKKKKEVLQEPQERRTVPRWLVEVAAKVLWEGQNEYVACNVSNVNMKGFSIALAAVLPDGCPSLKLQLEENFILNVDIEIGRHEVISGKHLYGVRVTRMRDSDKERLYQYIRQHFPDVAEKQLRGDTG